MISEMIEHYVEQVLRPVPINNIIVQFDGENDILSFNCFPTV
jgi:hypothetical protein